jgi:hypothetical protein
MKRTALFLSIAITAIADSPADRIANVPLRCKFFNFRDKLDSANISIFPALIPY